MDYEVANWFTSTHPASRLRNNLLVQRLMPKVRISLLNRCLTRHHQDGRVEEITILTPEHLGTALVNDFDLDVQGDAAALFAKLP